LLSKFLSKEKQTSLKNVESVFSKDSGKWDKFVEDAKRKSFVQSLQTDTRSDEKLKRHVDQINRLQTGKVLAQITSPGSLKSYDIVRKRGGGLGCTCADWRYKKSVAPEGQQECKHIKQYKSKKKPSLD
jgi:hypothetical protein